MPIVNMPPKPDRIYQAVREEFDGTALLIVRSKKEGEEDLAIVAGSMEEQEPRLKTEPAWGGCLESSPQVWVSINGAQPFLDYVISETKFYVLFIGVAWWNDWKTKAVQLLKSARRRQESAHIEPVRMDRTPIQHILEQIALLSAKGIELGTGAHERIDRLEPQVHNALNQIEDLRDDWAYTKDRIPATDGLRIRGWKIGAVLSPQKVGEECAEIAKKAGDIPPKTSRGNHQPLLHVQATLNRWELDWGCPKYSHLYDETKDRYGKDRPSLAGLKRPGEKQGFLPL